MTATFKFTLRKDKRNNNGECPIYLRITHNRKTKFLSTGIRVKPNDWNPITKNEKWVREGNRDHAILNSTLQNFLSNAKDARKELSEKDKLSSVAIKKRLKGNSKDNFFAIAEQYQKEIKEESYYTWKQNRVAIEKVKKHHGSEDLPLNYIDVSFLTKLVRFMQSKPYSNKASTIHKNFGAIRAILERAVLDQLLTENPMDDPSFRLPKSNGSKSKTKLSSEQIKALEELKLEKGSNLYHARNAFMLSYYFYGIRVGDLCTLTWKNVKDNRLQYEMSKTGNKIDVKIPTGAKRYLDMYHTEDSKDEDYILPFLNELSPAERKDSEAVRRKISTWNTIINGSNTSSDLAGLKKIADMAGIEETISMHVARHSFAQFAVDEKEVPTYKMMILLGHQSIKTTMQYLKTINVTAADEAADAIFDS